MMAQSWMSEFAIRGNVKESTVACLEECEFTWEQLAHNDLDGRYGRQPTRDELDDWIGLMQMLTKDIQLGVDYAYIDGWVFPTSETDLQFEGIHAQHVLRAVPQSAALLDRQSLEQTLASRRYWIEHAIDQQ